MRGAAREEPCWFVPGLVYIIYIYNQQYTEMWGVNHIDGVVCSHLLNVDDYQWRFRF